MSADKWVTIMDGLSMVWIGTIALLVYVHELSLRDERRERARLEAEAMIEEGVNFYVESKGENQ